MIPPRLKQMATARARSVGVSFGEFVRFALERALSENSTRRGRRSDPFLDDGVIFLGDIPEDLSQRHDDYLYGEK